MKYLIFDSGPLINLSMNGLLYILEDLKKTFNGKFLITKQVKYEVIDRPSGIPRFELGALMVQKLLDYGVLEMPSSVGISDGEITQKTNEFMTLANHSLKWQGNWVNIVSEAEMSCLALSSILSEKGTENIIALDERTTRVLSERPENLEKLMSFKMHKNVKVVTKSLGPLAKFRFIRSSEIVYVAYKKKILRISSPRALEAAIYATKFHGSSISWDEIKELKRL